MTIRRKLTAAAAACTGLTLSTGCMVTHVRTPQNSVTVTVNGVAVSGVGVNSAAEDVQKRIMAQKVNSIVADVQSGAIEVDAGPENKDEILVRARKTLHGDDPPNVLKALLPSVTVEASLDNGNLILRAVAPLDFAARHISVSVDYVVTVPPRLAFDLKTGSGQIKIDGVLGGGKLYTGYGDVNLSNVAGKLDVGSGSGSVSVQNADRVTALQARSSYGNIELELVSGDIDAITTSGEISLKSSPHVVSARLHSDYGSVTVSGVTGVVNASSNSGSVSISDSRLTIELTLHSNYGDVEANDISSIGETLGVDITTTSGEASYRGEASDLKIRSDYGAVSAELGSALKLADVDLYASFGSVELTLPSQASASVEASTTSGNVDLPDSSGSSGNPATGRYKLGAGAAPVKLQSQYGNVALKVK